MALTLEERKDLLRQIIPRLGRTSTSHGTGLDWNSYFKEHTDHATKLGYNEPNAGKGGTIWAANNVLGRALMLKEGIGTARPTPKPIPTGATLLSDPEQRRTLLQRISRNVPKSKLKGHQSWKLYFEQNPTEAVMLGYDQIKTNPKLWAANLRMTQQRNFKQSVREREFPPYEVKPQNGLHTPEVQQGIAELQEQAYQECKAEIKNLREEIKGCNAKIAELKEQLSDAKGIAYDLLAQLYRIKKG